jgi:hypothetical protein
MSSESISSPSMSKRQARTGGKLHKADQPWCIIEWSDLLIHDRGGSTAYSFLAPGTVAESLEPIVRRSIEVITGVWSGWKRQQGENLFPPRNTDSGLYS